ncbi:hypothetical protein ACFQ34_16195 [Pseudonocardia benzenivorans]|uniref:Uncharacterized protein n=2 Tax=Pseudonocardia TaxID=1847 RepID=F4CNG2_PSEUX|nr:hypothetical protein [Pseudonocardia dioxanivorans]AEA28260.1 hypothetical protein Psed_6158 [Pseudonocardia dioxanivorans CB1190]GJF02834.1 hypothetical protein PSD17_17960 [Pseudonocardia sp. D17]
MAPKTTSSPEDSEVLTVVTGPRGTSYECPDLATLDRHLTTLCARIRQATPQFPSLARAFRDDIDVLLDRRRWLELTSA